MGGPVNSRDYHALADVARDAWARSGQARYARHIDDRWEFMVRALFAIDAADRRRQLGRNPLPRTPSLTTLQAAKEFAPLVAAVAREHRVPLKVLLGPNRTRAVIWARHEAMWMIRNLPRAAPPSYPVIAAAVCRDDHTSAINGVKRFAARLAVDPVLRARVLGDELRQRRAA